MPRFEGTDVVAHPETYRDEHYEDRGDEAAEGQIIAVLPDALRALPLIATLPEEWQKDIALVVSKFVIAFDKSLTMTPEEQKAERDREIAAALQKSWPVRDDQSER